ncbi:MAG TPA: hypothetical protein V6C65_02665 [Allocoleopsis sp.]
MITRQFNLSQVQRSFKTIGLDDPLPHQQKSFNMIHHLSIAADNPLHVAQVLTE